MAAVIRLYFDENITVMVAAQLQRRGIECVTVRDLNLRGDSDINHLNRATEMGYVLCTYDQDYLRLAAEGMQHAGIVFGQQSIHGVGDWVRGLELICTIYTPEDMQNHVEYL